MPSQRNPRAGATLAAVILVLAAQGAAAGAQLFGGGGQGSGTCPPPGLDSVPDLDVGAFISAPWYAAYQVPVSYQPVDSLYCVLASYSQYSTKFGTAIKVLNYANQGAVNGPVTCTSCKANNAIDLSAVSPPLASGPTAASKLVVAPGFLVNTLPPLAVSKVTMSPNGNYWVVATGPSPDAAKYRWAIIIAGMTGPAQATDKGCSPSAMMDQGLWLFSRSPQAPEADVAEMLAVLAKLGISPERLVKVQQEGCKYEGAN
ncbi:hypothetical protein Rsub_05747 [Raphidocelis subcapitata]|uniref:Lipocalin/cytosolic fatty-acid binding domain-containing protein n=1 Tax=Raphidocelis subcapitata TaxID=307507 RepID=A0A2V0NZ47_9CHLO|nr:hypothetical protein Rsub_05747 [Raphidocelis subcapitata]|eukprot:GBF92911.1 hypothetical protein Rsub_05747 [Raphidocelis subcapitata]